MRSLYYAYCSRLVVAASVFGGDIALVLPFVGRELDLLHGAFGVLYHRLDRLRRPTTSPTASA